MTRALLLDRFRWVDGHADLWPVFRDGAAFAEVVKALAEPFRDAGVTAVCGIESRGFLLGGAVALELGVGFAAVRKAAGLFPGEKLTRETDPDYRGFRHVLRMQRSALRCLIAATSSRRRNRLYPVSSLPIRSAWGPSGSLSPETGAISRSGRVRDAELAKDELPEE